MIVLSGAAIFLHLTIIASFHHTVPNKQPFGGRRKRSASMGAHVLVQTPSPTSVAVNQNELLDLNKEMIRLGVYTLGDESRHRPGEKLRDEKLREACLHNAAVYSDFGQDEKANVWNLLAQMAENALEDEHDNFNGWGGPFCGSLGQDTVSSFLDFYEAQGDVQMLATMVCVLGGGPRTRITEGSSFLPLSHQDRYDSYIRRYADLLYRWRLMSKRAELRKHLEYRLPEMYDNDESAAIAIDVSCSRCHRELTTDDSICRHCRNYAFRCSICDIAVRGLFTICGRCGHGGHTSHLKEWFGKHEVCPTGCGCNCLLVTTMQTGNASSTGPLQPIIDGGAIGEDGGWAMVGMEDQIPTSTRGQSNAMVVEG